MSTSPDHATNVEDRRISLPSHWVAGRLGSDELRARLDEIEVGKLGDVEAEALEELRAELAAAKPHERALLEPVVRETIEALALGV